MPFSRPDKSTKISLNKKTLTGVDLKSIIYYFLASKNCSILQTERNDMPMPMPMIPVHLVIVLVDTDVPMHQPHKKIVFASKKAHDEVPLPESKIELHINGQLFIFEQERLWLCQGNQMRAILTLIKSESFEQCLVALQSSPDAWIQV